MFLELNPSSIAKVEEKFESRTGLLRNPKASHCEALASFPPVREVMAKPWQTNQEVQSFH